MSYRFVDTFRAEPVLLESSLQTYMTYTTAEFTVNKLHDDGQRNFPKRVEFHARINLWN
jgi:hypothetical protein